MTANNTAMRQTCSRTLLATLLASLAGAAAAGCGGGSPGYYPSSYPSQGAPEPAAAEEADYSSGGDSGSAAKSAPPPPMPSPGAADGAPAEAARPRSASDPFSIAKPESRPGLATQWGEERHSRVTTAPFVRANRLQPFALGKVFYNDPQGIAAMSGGSRLAASRFSVYSGYVDVGLDDESGNPLAGFVSGSDNYVVGRKGQRYTIIVRNHGPGRLEAVVSVDGLDVIDGKPASFSKRGYLVDPFGELEIDGWRTSTSKVAAFRFGSVSSSYAAKKHGETRNVGVIGVAVFHERGDSPQQWNRGNDSGQRKDADPFPKQYATPPN